MKQRYIVIAFATIWIVFSEFLRNQVLFASYWKDHYASLGLEFPSKPINGLVWTIWSCILASVIYKLLQKYSFKETIVLAWTVGFVMMWLVIGNLMVLPVKLLIFAVPLSLLEVYIATLILTKTSK